jgi:hypothetical protein
VKALIAGAGIGGQMEDANTKGAVKSPMRVRVMYNQIEDE